MKRLDISNETLRELARIGVHIADYNYSELGWKSASLGLTAHLEGFHWDSLEECFGDTHQNIEWMNENNPSTLW
ncbi:MAG: hypothetical protein HXN12_00440 [Porphyromonadaceae bacterium]|nr:hypothetical protein [Porphyromonadaceae bacterium]